MAIRYSQWKTKSHIPTDSRLQEKSILFVFFGPEIALILQPPSRAHSGESSYRDSSTVWIDHDRRTHSR